MNNWRAYRTNIPQFFLISKHYVIFFSIVSCNRKNTITCFCFVSHTQHPTRMSDIHIWIHAYRDNETEHPRNMRSKRFRANGLLALWVALIHIKVKNIYNELLWMEANTQYAWGTCIDMDTWNELRTLTQRTSEHLFFLFKNVFSDPFWWRSFEKFLAFFSLLHNHRLVEFIFNS